MRQRQWVLPSIGAAMFAFSLYHVLRAQDAREHPPPLALPTLASGERLAGTGVIEPASENIHAGSHRAGIVAAVHVRAHEQVRQGALLFCLDDRSQRASLHAAEAELSAARAQLDRLTQLPRSEELPPLLARVDQARARLEDVDDQLRRTTQMVSAGALPDDQAVRARQQREVAASELRAAQAELDLKRAGSWLPELTVARAAVRQAGANVERANTELELLCARASLDATVLRVDVRPGEFVSAGPSASLVTLGVTTTLHVRADFDEVEIPRFRTDLPARAFIRGSSAAFPLEFVRLEPWVLPKRTLSGASSERLDTRVLQVIYRFEAPPAAVFVGQQVDVTVERASSDAKLGQVGAYAP